MNFDVIRTCIILLVKPDGKIYRMEDNIKMDVKEASRSVLDWILHLQDRFICNIILHFLTFYIIIPHDGYMPRSSHPP
jgi:hypothetical protein